MVFYIWLGGVLHALTHSDGVLDMDLVNPSYCENLSSNISSETSLKVNFDDIKPIYYPRAGALDEDISRIESEAISLFPFKAFNDYFSRDIVNNKLHEISPEKQKIILSALNNS